jgi:hypothetical protein
MGPNIILNDIHCELPTIRIRKITILTDKPRLAAKVFQKNLYENHGYPEIFTERKNAIDYLPKVSPTTYDAPKVKDHSGMMYHKPESADEINMHDLWVTKRKQEVLNFLFIP